ncbi:MAG: hypothetical protein KJ732_04970, partial [Candidatus Margulisbacteria bacterium]|nr:hypothetical protein [Candidatus Margulisiibacteriota bacterium]
MQGLKGVSRNGRFLLADTEKDVWTKIAFKSENDFAGLGLDGNPAAVKEFISGIEAARMAPIFRHPEDVKAFFSGPEAAKTFLACASKFIMRFEEEGNLDIFKGLKDSKKIASVLLERDENGNYNGIGTMTTPLRQSLELTRSEKQEISLFLSKSVFGRKASVCGLKEEEKESVKIELGFGAPFHYADKVDKPSQVAAGSKPKIEIPEMIDDSRLPFRVAKGVVPG